MVQTAWATKQARAREHIADLASEIEAMQIQRKLAVHVERDGPDRVLIAIVPDPIPPRISAIVGDAVHNARSALDVFASALWPHRLSRALTASEEGAVAFPITGTLDEFDTWFKRRSSRLPPLDGDAMHHLRSVQPWYYDWQASEVLGREPQWPDRRFDLLLRLRDLNNHDKHRRLAICGVFPHQIGAGHAQGHDVGWRQGTQPIRNGVEIGRWIPPHDAPDMKIEHMGTLSLMLEQDLAAGMLDPVPDMVAAMASQVDVVLRQLSLLLR